MVSMVLTCNTEMNEPQPLASTPDDRVSTAVRQRFQAGDLDALGEVYDAYAGAVHTVVRSVLGSGGQADDAVQEAFMRAWRGAGSFDPRRPLGPWLFTIARRTSIDILRREGRPNRSDHAELTDDVGADRSDLDRPGIEAAWERWQIRLALEQLPEEERTVLMLSHFHGYTHPQIAERLGVPPGTVKSRSHRGHRRLSVLLGHLVAPDLQLAPPPDDPEASP